METCCCETGPVYKVFVFNSSFIETLKSKGMGSDGFPSNMCEGDKTIVNASVK